MPFTADQLIIQLEFFATYLATILSQDPAKDLKHKYMHHKKQSAVVFIALAIRRQVKANKDYINEAMKFIEAREEICTKIHNSFIRLVFSKAVAKDRGLSVADIKVAIIDLIVEGDYTPPKRKKNEKNRQDRGRGPGRDRNNERYDRNQSHRRRGFFDFDFSKAMEASKNNRDSVPKFNNKAACLLCAVNGDNSCRKRFVTLFHGTFTDDHVEKMKKFASDNNFELKKRG